MSPLEVLHATFESIMLLLMVAKADGSYDVGDDMQSCNIASLLLQHFNSDLQSLQP